MSTNSKNVLTVMVMLVIVIAVLIFSNMSKAETAYTIKTTDVLMDSVSYSYPSRQDSITQDTAKKLTNKELKEKAYYEFKSKEIRQEKNLEKLDYQNKLMDSLINKKEVVKKYDAKPKKPGT